MTYLAKKIEDTINEILFIAGNKSEILVGDCHCDKNYTNTQKHILMLLKEDEISNKDLAEKLNMTQAAVTKAIKSLITDEMITAQKDMSDGRIIRYKLSKEALNVADEHKAHHHRTIDSYQKLLANYSANEQDLIDRFLNDLIRKIRD